MRIKRDQNTKQGVRPRAMEFLRILNKQLVTGRHCGSDGTGNKSAEWLGEVTQAIACCVPESWMGECDIECDQVKKVIVKKRNWSPPGPDRIVNYWF